MRLFLQLGIGLFNPLLCIEFQKFLVIYQVFIHGVYSIFGSIAGIIELIKDGIFYNLEDLHF